MSVSSKHFYRFSYLKSDHWEDLRLSKLAASKGRCLGCGHEAFNNDVHHLRYRNLYDVDKGDLAVLCRSCHKKIHEYLDNHPEVKIEDPWKFFYAVLETIRPPNYRPSNFRNCKTKRGFYHRMFSQAKWRLMESGSEFADAMEWHPWCANKMAAVEPLTDEAILAISRECPFSKQYPTSRHLNRAAITTMNDNENKNKAPY